MKTSEIIEKLKAFEFLDPSRRAAFLNTLEFLAQDHPDYYDDIFPVILPRIFDSSPNGINHGDGYSIANHFFKTKPPAGSLSRYVKNVEAIYEKRLKSVGCNGWDCPEAVIKEGKLNAYNNITAALGPEGIPLLEKIENAGLKHTKKLELCMGALTPKTKQTYFFTFLNQLNAKPKDIDYDTVRALLMTDHADYIIETLTDRLTHLKSIAAEKDGSVQEFKVSRNRYIVYGIPRKFQTLPAGQRYNEIMTLEDVLNEHNENRRFCEYRKTSGSSFDPSY